jgi:hypothetical protein
MRKEISQYQLVGKLDFTCVYGNLFSSSFLLACDGVYLSREGTAFHSFGILEQVGDVFLLSVQ